MIQPRMRNLALATALAAVTATAWATSETVSNSAYVPASEPVVLAPADVEATPASEPMSEPVAVSDTLSPNESVVASNRTVPVVERSVVQAPIRVEEKRLTLDQRIKGDVMDRLTDGTMNISGKIGVESHDAVVVLTGYTSTAGQAQRAARAAGSVTGVKSVQNEIRPRVGGSV